MSGFDGLHPVVQHHVVNTLGWSALRPLQDAAVPPLLRGEDAILLAPTAGGKTEAAIFPILSRMAAEGWRGTSVLYVCPLRALLNNLEPRVASYAGWLGRTAAVRHGDTGQGARRRQAIDRPDILLTTPESLEAILVSATVDPRVLLSDVRCVIVDEVHAFAGDDRGWHLLAVLERITRIAEHPLQRIGLSATVGNPAELLTWLQGSNRVAGHGQVVAPAVEVSRAADVALDYVGSLQNAATVISRLHVGEKRLVFADSRRTVEELAGSLMRAETETYVSHSSLSIDERRRAETAFAEARDCVIVSTSTLELGIDVGDLDRVIQLGAPGTVASLLQRLGRTGRRPGTSRNMLFLAVTETELLRAFGLALLWSEGYVEPITPTPTPNHLVAQQLLALVLQERQVGQQTWPAWLGGLPLAEPPMMREIADWLVASGHLDTDTGMLFIGSETEKKYGRRHFMELMTVFTSNPQFSVLFGRDEIGVVDPMVLVAKVHGPRILALAGRSWQVTSVDWTRHRAYVEPSDGAGLARWLGTTAPRSFALTDAIRRVLLGADPAGVTISQRAAAELENQRTQWAKCVDSDRTVVLLENGESSCWTWAGGRANAVLHAALGDVAPALLDPIETFDNERIRLRAGVAATDLGPALHEIAERLRSGWAVQPDVSQRAVQDLKFVDLLPPDVAVATLAARFADRPGAERAASRPLVQVFV